MPKELLEMIENFNANLSIVSSWVDGKIKLKQMILEAIENMCQCFRYINE